MTEDNQDKTPPKLRLSRTPKEAGEHQSNESKAESAQTGEEAPKAPPGIKLKLSSQGPVPAEEPQGAPAKTDSPKKEPAPAIKAEVPPPSAAANRQEKTPPLTEEKESDSQAAAPSRPKLKTQSDFDPENPFAGIVKEPKKREKTPPELPNKPAPPSKDDAAQKAEEAITRMNGGDGKTRGMLTSIIIIIILLGLLGGSGYGLYYVLKKPGATADSTDSRKEEEAVSHSETGQTIGEQADAGPIAKAKAAISKVPSADPILEEQDPLQTTAASRSTSATAIEGLKPNTVDRKPEPEPRSIAKNSTGETDKTSPTATAVSAAPKQAAAISSFLQTIHIDGVRSGERPKVMLNGESYEAGDLVNPQFGLRFTGIRDGKLAFRDDAGVVYIKSF